MNIMDQIYKTLEEQGFKLRPVLIQDLDAVAQLILEVCTADGDPTVASSREDLERLWQNPEADLMKDFWVVETGEARIVGYEEFYNRYRNTHLSGDGYVHPQFLGRGIGTTLLRALERRAREAMTSAEPGMRVFIRNGMAVRDLRGQELHGHEGYQPIRYAWRMEIHLEATPPASVWPQGIALKPFDLKEHNHLVFETDEEAFLDHWGHAPSTYERWQRQMTDRSDFDPSLWYIAWDQDQIAGYALCRYRMGIGWVGVLGVRRPWRKRGLGLALLNHSFWEFYHKGMKTVGLGVDAANQTGATRLYKKAGMSVASEYVIYEKELRPGRELTLKED